jgi:UDP-N-acetylglucosamine 4,6-dehydratase
MAANIGDYCEKTGEITDERILIFGGSGSLGKTTIERWTKSNTIINVSRDEEKQWQLKSAINSQHLSQIIGDISIEEDVCNAILLTKPTIICIFACLKHIDLCEKFPKKSISINTNGIMNVQNTLMKYNTPVHTVLFVSTDKACLPITTYGCSKAISEFFLQGIKFNGIKWVGVRYGNVLNSSGSIIPYLRNNSLSSSPYTLTHPDMTRFIMTLDQSVNLIEHALIHGKHNEIIIPDICSMRIKDLFEIFESKYNKTTVVTGLRCKEKIHEDLISDSEAKMTYKIGNYYHIGTIQIPNNSIKSVSSNMNLIDKKTLEAYLIEKDLFKM